MSWLIAAIDPGDVWCGLAVFRLSREAEAMHQCDDLDCSRKGRVRLAYAMTLPPPETYDWLEKNARTLHALVIERYQLYPWLAREQGFSEFPTAQCVGICGYIAGKAGVPVYKQDAKGSLREGRAQAKAIGFDMRDRRLGSGRFAYYGPDFARLPGKPHRRDAAAHGVRWAVLSEHSPLLRRTDG
jgi:hypothetical protein